MSRWLTLVTVGILVLAISSGTSATVTNFSPLPDNDGTGTIVGYVKNQNGSGIVGANITIRDRWNRYTYVTCTDNNGYFKVTNVKTNYLHGEYYAKYYAVYANKEGYFPGVRLACVHPGKTTRVDIVLAKETREGWIAGYTRNFEGEPLKDVLVVAISYCFSYPAFNYSISDSSGYFNISVPGNAYYIVQAAAAGKIVSFQLSDMVYVFEGETTIVNFSFPIRGSSATDNATDARTTAESKLQEILFTLMETNEEFRKMYLSTETIDSKNTIEKIDSKGTHDVERSVSLTDKSKQTKVIRSAPLKFRLSEIISRHAKNHIRIKGFSIAIVTIKQIHLFQIFKTTHEQNCRDKEQKEHQPYLKQKDNITARKNLG